MWSPKAIGVKTRTSADARAHLCHEQMKGYRLRSLLAFRIASSTVVGEIKVNMYSDLLMSVM